MNQAQHLINGVFADQIAIFDRGLHYGDGLFETIAVYKGQLLLWQEHLLRLKQGCERLNIAFPEPQLLFNETKQLTNGKEMAVLKLILTRGSGGRGYKAPAKINTTRILGIYDWPSYQTNLHTEGVEVRVCETRLASNPTLAGLKHLNRLEQVLARNEWHDDTVFEGLMLDTNDKVIEASMSNLFLVKDGILITADLSACGINGIIRELILKLAAKLKLKYEIKAIYLDDVFNSDEAFLSNSIIGLLPIKKINDIHFSQFTFSNEISRHLLKENYIVPL